MSETYDTLTAHLAFKEQGKAVYILHPDGEDYKIVHESEILDSDGHLFLIKEEK